MKQLLIAIAATAILASCHNNADTAAIESAKQATIDSMNTVAAEKEHAAKVKSNHRHSSEAVPSGAGNTSTASAGTAAPAKKKGWSHTAKGAVVGAGAGAITGAIINKDHVKGAAIGTIVGAGVGAGVGAIVDHEKKKKEAAQQQ